MPEGYNQMKYYVTSGTLQWVGNADSPEQACQIAIQHASNDTIDPYFFYISQKGYRTDKGRFIAEEKLQTDDILES